MGAGNLPGAGEGPSARGWGSGSGLVGRTGIRWPQAGQWALAKPGWDEPG